MCTLLQMGIFDMARNDERRGFPCSRRQISDWITSIATIRLYDVWPRRCNIWSGSCNTQAANRVAAVRRRRCCWSAWTLRFDQQKDEHAHDKEKEQEQDLPLGIFTLIARSLR